MLLQAETMRTFSCR